MQKILTCRFYLYYRTHTTHLLSQCLQLLCRMSCQGSTNDGDSGGSHTQFIDTQADKNGDKAYIAGDLTTDSDGFSCTATSFRYLTDHAQQGRLHRLVEMSNAFV